MGSGFGDAVNNNCCWQPVTDYIESQFEQFFKDESGLNRKNIQDNRVHCCLYFISPIGHGLRPIDKEVMKVNVNNTQPTTLSQQHSVNNTQSTTLSQQHSANNT